MMFRYGLQRDRLVPDRRPDSTILFHVVRHECLFGPSAFDNGVFKFSEPFECRQLQEQQRRCFVQLHSYISLESNGGQKLLTSLNVQNNFAANSEYGDSSWPIRMVNQRRLARKSNYAKSPAADLLLDMPNLPKDWLRKILDWSATDYLTAAIESSVHLWSGRTQSVQYTINAAAASEPGRPKTKTTVDCLKWDARGEKLAYSFTVEQDLDSPSSTPRHGHDAADQSTPATGDTSWASADSMVIVSDEDALLTPRLRLNASASLDRFAGTFHRNAFPERASYVKVWLLNGQNDNTNRINLSTCGCTNDVNYSRDDSCSIVVMDWRANDHTLVTGCTSGTVTFFQYDDVQKNLVTIRTVRNDEIGISLLSLISCLRVSLDNYSRHVAVAFYTFQAGYLKVWRMQDSSEFDVDYCGRNKKHCSDFSISLNETFSDRYKKKSSSSRLVIKAMAWHPWKHSLLCYAVTSLDLDPLLAGPLTPSWLVLANVCSGQVLKRVNQTACCSCPMVKILSVTTHSMTFSRATGELLASNLTVYRIQENSMSVPKIIEKNSVVVMHALDRVVETLNRNYVDMGLFFAWSPDGSRIALTSSDESLRIWNFWPSTAGRNHSDSRPTYNRATATFLSDSVQLTAAEHRGGLTYSLETNNHHWYRSNQSAVSSQLSLDASRVIK